MRLLLQSPGSSMSDEFYRQLREVKLRLAQAEPVLTAEDRDRSSWSHITDAMKSLEAAERGIRRIDALGAEARNPPIRGP